MLSDLISPIQALMYSSVMVGVAYRTRKFAKEGFHDVISISLLMFVPSDDNEEGYALAVRTLKEASLKEVFIDEGAMDSLKTAAAHSISTVSNPHQHFCDMVHLPDPLHTVTRFREHCNSKLSDLFCIFQTLSAMRVGPIVTRRFCWVVTYESAPPPPRSTLTHNWASVSSRHLNDNNDEPSKQANHNTPSVTSEHSASNKFRLILVELDCLRQSHLKSSKDMPYEMDGEHFHRRWELIQEMQPLFNMRTGMSQPGSTILCGSVIFSAPVMTMIYESSVLTQKEWSFAPWESW